MEKEKWKDVFGGRYAVSTLGRVIRNTPAKGAQVGKILQTPLSKKGQDRDGKPYKYAIVRLCGGKGWVKQMHVHRLVAETFIGPCPEGYCVNHRDGDKTNNALSNLEYISIRENALHASLLGLLVRGEEHRQAKITEQDVLNIREAVAKGTKYDDLCSKYHLNRSTLHSIVYHKTWKHVGGPKPSRRLLKNRAKLTEDQVRLIRGFYAKGAKIVDLCKMFDVAEGTVHPLVHRKTWKHVN